MLCVQQSDFSCPGLKDDHLLLPVLVIPLLSAETLQRLCGGQGQQRDRQEERYRDLENNFVEWVGKNHLLF